jgi:hypothetical protein
MTYQVGEAAGTQERFMAVFTGTGSYGGSSSGAEALTITKEDATILYGSGNPAAMQVSSAGGALNAGGLTLLFSVKETSPDVAAATSAVGSIANAALSVTLVPVGPGSNYQLTCTAGTVTGVGYAAERPFSCTNAAAIAVTAYEVQASVAGNYYTGTYSDALTVFDPSLGFASGGGGPTIDGDRVSIGFITRYKKGGSNLQGNLIVVRHHAAGTLSRLKATALGSLALGQDANIPMGWVTLTGKATYTTWDAGQAAYVTNGNQSFALYGEDRNNPGAGIDRIWLGGPGVLAMPGTLLTAAANAQDLTRGDIAVPHGKGKRPRRDPVPARHGTGSRSERLLATPRCDVIHHDVIGSPTGASSGTRSGVIGVTRQRSEAATLGGARGGIGDARSDATAGACSTTGKRGVTPTIDFDSGALVARTTPRTQRQ